MKKSLYLVLLFLLTVPVFTQEDSLSLMLVGSVILTEDLAAEQTEEEQQALIKEQRQIFLAALQENLQREYLVTTGDPQWSDLPVLEIQNLVVSSGQDLMVYGLLILQPRRALIQLTLYDPAAGNLLGSSQGFGRWQRITFINDLDEAVDGLMENSDLDYLTMMREDPDYKEKNRPVRIFLEPVQPDVLIYLNSEEPFAVTTDSPLELPFHPYPIGQEIVIRLEKEGYYTVEEEILLDKSNIAHKLPTLIPSTDRALLLRSNYYQIYGLGGGFRYYLKPDEFYLNAVEYIFLTPPLGETGETSLHFDSMIEVGYYPFFSKSTSFFRYGISAGLGGIISLAGSPRSIYFDPYMNWTTLFVELNFSRFALDLRWENRFNFSGENSLLPQGTMGPVIPSENDDDNDPLPLFGLELIWKL